VVLPDETPKAAGETTPDRRQSLAERVRERWKTPVVTEETRGQPAKGARSPWREDLPSPRCVFEDYRDGARHYGDGAWLIAGAYWAVSALPLAFNQLMAAGHVASQRTGRFWVFVVLVPALFTVCLLVFS
jgi:hypothetical protein